MLVALCIYMAAILILRLLHAENLLLVAGISIAFLVYVEHAARKY